MNILLYVLVILMALAITTYTRLQTFLTASATRNQYVCYINQKSTSDNNYYQTKLYTDHKRKSNNPGNTGKKIKATRKLNFALLTQEEYRKSNPVAYDTIRLITYRLLHQLYDGNPFFQELETTHGDPAEALIQAIIARSQNLPEGLKIASVDDLKALDLEDEQLQEAYAKILKGENDPSLTGNCAILANTGYPSLLEYIDVRGGKSKNLPLRVQFLPPEVLKAVFIDENIVEQIITKRDELAATAGKIGSPEQQVATSTFESLFKRGVSQGLNPELFNFSITKQKKKK